MKTGMLTIAVTVCVVGAFVAAVRGEWLFVVAVTFLAVSAALRLGSSRRSSTAEIADESIAADLRQSARGRALAEIRDIHGEVAAVRELRREYRHLPLTRVVRVVRSL